MAGDQPAELLICGRANFSGQLASLTWANAHSVLFVFADRRVVKVSRGGLTSRLWETFVGAPVWWGRLTGHPDHFLPPPTPLTAYYVLNPGGQEAARPVFLYSSREELVVARQSWHGLLREFWHDFNAAYFAEHNLYDRALVDENFAIAHDQSGDAVYGWVMEMDKRNTDDNQQTIISIYNLWLNNGYRVDFSAKSGGTYYFLLTGGQMVLSRKREALKALETAPHTVRWSGGRVPRGLVDHRTGTLFLVDDGRGCVYGVLNWERPNFFAADTPSLVRGEKEEEEMRFSARGTPFEDFFKCWNVRPHLIEGAGEEGTNRCNLGGESGNAYSLSVTAHHQLTSTEGGDDSGGGGGGNDDEDGGTGEKSGGSGGGSGGTSNLFWALFSGGGIFLLLLLLVIGLYKKKGLLCSKGKIGSKKSVLGSSKTKKSGGGQKGVAKSSVSPIGEKSTAGDATSGNFPTSSSSASTSPLKK